MANIFSKTYIMYRDGFKSMTVGRTLWVVIAIKLAIMFLVVKLFFFPNKLNEDYATDEERSNAVMESLIINRK